MDRINLRLHRGFTLVEVLVVVTIITMVVGMATFVATSYVKTARDSERESKSTIIASALEKYYEQNGEYPNCSDVTASPSAVKSSTLTSISSEDILKTPMASSGDNSIRCDADISTTDYDDVFVYTCTAETGACNEWKLKYRKELDGQIVTIASKYNASSGGVVIAPPEIPVLVAPDITLAASLSGQNGVASASATCAEGNPEYQIRAYRNQGSFPSTWISSSSTTISALNEGESASFQARARCVDPDFTASNYKLSNVAGVNRTVTAPVGLVTSATISGAYAIGSVTGGSCASGTVLQRQIQTLQSSYLYGGTWSGFQDISGTSKTEPVNEGWQRSFHQIARCVNSITGVASDWTWGPTGDAVRPISTLGAPWVSASGNNSRIAYSWGGNGCPTGTTKEYQWYLTREGYNSGWWGPSTGTNFDWNDNSQGFTFNAVVVQRCVSGFTSGGWSAGGSASYSRGVSAPGAPYGFSVDVVGTGGIAYSWTAPACAIGTAGQWQADWANQGGSGISWVNAPSGRDSNWWYGLNSYDESSARPGGSWSDAWPSYGYLGDRNNDYATKPPRMNLDVGTPGAFDANNYLRMAVHYRCRNTTTGQVGPVGPVNSYSHRW